MRGSVSPANSRCSIARSLQVVGEKWALLIVRDVQRGHTRFSTLRARLEVAPDVLADRLAKLVELGVLERRGYRTPGERERAEYHLTAAGTDLLPVLAALAAWGDAHVPSGFGPAAIFTDAATGDPVELAFVRADGSRLGLGDVAVVRGPGALEAAPVAP
ncbi:MAG TPA: helix-turn-helix domain-containing protein [Pseudolysinimonas sp.]|nr:helix-turn-helix domain-containing protein [Pseudolysinimonas sp.]